MENYGHITVLLEESVKYLINDTKTGIFVDATLGGGGTSEYILKQIDRTGRVLGIDQDTTAIEISNRRLNPYPNFKAIRKNFRALREVLEDEKIEGIDGIIFDLGVSSMQLEDPNRGFSFKDELNSRLDMRMDQDSNKTSAYDLVMKLDERSLYTLFKKYGEDRWAGRVASRIVEFRRQKPIETTAELALLISQAIPKKFQSRRIHPATRFFQALRIAVNEELQALEEGLLAGIDALKSEGRIVVISYHSLEDRIVKHTFRQKDKENEIRIITKKPILPTEEEINKNPKSRSAKMRVAQKI
jgi:16S rRNA (cytosine1402-N4)-methyltransferase